MAGIEHDILHVDQPVDPARSARIRVRLLQSGILVFFAVVCLRLIQIQVVESPKFREIAQKQYQSKVILPAARGAFVDRNENTIATNSVFVSFAADPKVAVEDARAIATTFAKLFGKPKSYYLEKLRSDSRFVWLERQVDGNTANRIAEMKLGGVIARNEPKRLYYHDQVAGQLIGCTDIDNNGIAGLELEFNQELRGADGYVIFQRDGLGRARPTVDYPRIEPIDGNSIALTIDMGLQAIAEKEVKRGVEQSKADRGIVVMLQPKTGEILALAQYPCIDPNNFGKYEADDQRLRAATDIFEPGSVFKIVTASAALEYNLVQPDRKFFAENGTYIVHAASGKSRTITDTHKEGWITFQQAVEVSSNIVMAKASEIIGSERLYKMARDYGFGIATNVEFPGEVKGVLKKPVEWSGTTLNTIAFGYEVGVTPLQIAAAYAAVANGGILMKPYLFSREIDDNGLIVRTSQPQVIRRVVSEQTAKTLTDFFTGVVERGTGKPAALPGMKVAGKTGTSRKLIEGRYEQGNYTASFVGYVPADDPQLVCLVMLDNPRGGNYTGGTVSAPVFRAIVERAMSISNIFAPMAQARTIITKNEPQSNMKDGEGQEALANTVAEQTTPKLKSGIVPDVRGYSLRRAVGVLTTGKLEPVVNGSGIVIQQSPEAGQFAKPGTKVFLTCQPKSLSAN
ncbi:MAG: transpeptidase family protein [Ignavibacteriae bacterium]|nr:transpeptidase family protein [Ignavibacteriota bacterium]